MLTTRWQPFGDVFSELNRLQHDMNRLFNRFGLTNGGGERRIAPAYPALDLWQDEDNFYVEAELPGMKLEDTEVYVTAGNQLTLKGKREAPVVENGTWHRRERGFGEFSRAITLPQDVDADLVAAAFQNGILTITLPKMEATKPLRISVKAN